MVEIRLFGHMRVTPVGAPAALALRPRAQRLLAYLLLHRHQPQHRSRLAFSLWADLPEKDALGTFRRALSELRTALPALPGSDWIVTDGDEVRWNLAVPQWLDVAEFEAGLRAGTLDGLQRAAAVYGGDLLAAFDEPWIDPEREHFREMQFTALRQLAAHRRAAGDYAGAVALARQALLLEPLAENVYREIMLALYAGGDRAAALAEYDRLSQQLRDELAVEPMPETQELRAAIAAGQVPAAAPPAPERPAAPPAPLLGRSPELEMLRAAWDSARAGRGGCVLVSGEAGVGKTHLVQHLAAQAAQQSGLALVGHCYEFENALPYEAVAEMLRAAAGPLQHAGLTPFQLARLARLAPGAVSGPVLEAASGPEENRLQLFETLIQAFVALTAQQPVLLLVEDVHWAAESTLDWLTFLMPRLSAHRLLVIVTHRTGEEGGERALARLRQRFEREGVLTTLLLRPLSREAYRGLVEARSGLAGAAAGRLADWLHDETGGNPFFMQEIVNGLIEAGQIVVGASGWTGPATGADYSPRVPLPDTLRATIAARVQRLPEGARGFLQAAAVAGRVFNFDIVCRAGGWNEEAALDAVEALLARELIRETGPAGSFAFAHHLVQEAIYAGLASPRRQFWHRRLMETVLAVNPWDFAALAHHSAAAGEPQAAIGYAQRAAQQYSDLCAYEEAIHYLRTALDLMDGGTPPDVRLAALESLGDNYRKLFQGLPAVQAYRAALELAGDRVSDGRLAALRLIRKIFQMTGDMWEALPIEQFDEAAAIAERLRARLPDLLAWMAQEPPHAEFVALLRVLAMDTIIVRRPAGGNAALVYSQMSVAMAERLEQPVVLASALVAQSAVFGARGLPLERAATARRALAVSRDPRFDDVLERIYALIAAGGALISLGQYSEAMAMLHEAEQIADPLRAVQLQNWTLSLLVYALFRLDRWDEALGVEARRRGLQERYQLSRLGAPCFSLGLAAAVHALRGDASDSAACQAESSAIMSQVSGPLERWGRSQRF